MKKTTLILFLLVLQQSYFAQLKDLNLKNVLVVAQLDKPEERFTLEVALAEILAEAGIKTMVSLNVLKQGASIEQLGYDSIKAALKAKGIDTYMLVSVRGYDKKFKRATLNNDLATELTISHLFPLYRDNIASVSLEFNFYRAGQFIGSDLLKISGVAKRETVLKKLRKKLPKKINKRWK